METNELVLNFSEVCSLAMCAVAVMLAEYVLVLLAVLADLWSGVRKARQRGEARRSHALRRTVDKLARYYNTLLALSVVDLMQMGLVIYARVTMQWELLLVPVFTVLGAIGVAIIEVKSIFEHASEKEQADYREAIAMMEKIMKQVGQIKKN